MRRATTVGFFSPSQTHIALFLHGIQFSSLATLVPVPTFGVPPWLFPSPASAILALTLLFASNLGLRHFPDYGSSSQAIWNGESWSVLLGLGSLPYGPGSDFGPFAEPAVACSRRLPLW